MGYNFARSTLPNKPPSKPGEIDFDEQMGDE